MPRIWCSGRGRSPLWRRACGRTLSSQLMRQMQDLTIHVIPRSTPGPRRSVRPYRAEPWWAWPAAAAAVAVVTLGGLALNGIVPGEAMGMIYVAVIVAASQRLRHARGAGAGGGGVFLRGISFSSRRSIN